MRIWPPMLISRLATRRRLPCSSRRQPSFLVNPSTRYAPFCLSSSDHRMGKESHEERTATQPRDPSLHTVVLSGIDQINENIRICRLDIPPGTPPIRFLPGQWLDTYPPGISKAGGFTITSPPSRARAVADPHGAAPAPGYLELAVQRSPANPAAAFFWRDAAGGGGRGGEGGILGSEVRVRVGGAFVWPPPGVNVLSGGLRRVVFAAGGVGVNPLVSMLAQLAEQQQQQQQQQQKGPGGGNRLEVEFLYSMRDPAADGVGGRSEEDEKRDARRMLFLERIARVFQDGKVRGRLRLFLTGGGDGGGGGTVSCNGQDVPFSRRRMTLDDVAAAVGADKRFAVVYVCGVPTMTDYFVRELTSPQGVGMEPHRILHEKWW